MATVAGFNASGLLSLLDEDDESLKLYALQSLNRIVHEFWFQIASQQAIASVEAFYEDESFSHRELAALVASKASNHTAPSILGGSDAELIADHLGLLPFGRA